MKAFSLFLSSRRTCELDRGSPDGAVAPPSLLKKEVDPAPDPAVPIIDFSIAERPNTLLVDRDGSVSPPLPRLVDLPNPVDGALPPSGPTPSSGRTKPKCSMILIF